ncbi:biotin-independent malonate decarboxylase subunit gamma, partial [Burkholderia cenocepacia]|uniref:biotin-independent malonate decarboxylase subunit gamma n=1 Tax=Burkholderia cenocepacia TaxID=95486 RepID=UPI0024B7A648
PGAEPEVMDLPSMSRVTKLPIDVLKEMARSTPVFAPGLDNLVKMGAVSVTSVWRRSGSSACGTRECLDA